MTSKRRCPAGGNGRASGGISKADCIAGSQDKPLSQPGQTSAPPQSFDLRRYPIIGLHWFGIEMPDYPHVLSPDKDEMAAPSLWPGGAP